MFEITDPRFSARVSAHLDLANTQAKETTADKVSLSFLDAATRYNVWLWAATATDVTELHTRRAEALQGLLDEVRRRFDKHFDDYSQNFDQSIVAQRQPRQPS